MEIRGKVINVLPIRQGQSQSTGRPWMMKEVIIETYDQYPRKVLIELFGEDRIKSNPCEVGEDILVSFDLESRSYVGRDGVERWSTSARAYRIDKADAMQAPAPVGFDPMAGQFGAAPQAGFAQPQMGFAQPQAQAAPMFSAPAPQPVVPQMPTAAPVADVVTNAPAPAGDDLPF